MPGFPQHDWTCRYKLLLPTFPFQLYNNAQTAKAPERSFSCTDSEQQWTIKDDKKTYIEVKSETVTNIYERLFIKAKQFNRNTNYWDDANLLSGSNTDYWVHYFLYNDKWHYIFMTKAELKQLCYKYGS